MSDETKSQFARPYINFHTDFAEVMSHDGVCLACIDLPAALSAVDENTYYKAYGRKPTDGEVTAAIKAISEEFQKPDSETPLSPFWVCTCGCKVLPLWQKGEIANTTKVISVLSCDSHSGEVGFDLRDVAVNKIMFGRRATQAEAGELGFHLSFLVILGSHKYADIIARRRTAAIVRDYEALQSDE